MSDSDTTGGLDFIRRKVQEDNRSGRYDGRVVTRFPPEPNGFLHIGHAKSICLNFQIAAENEGGRCHLRFDDTNPQKEEVRYVESIQQDVRWLGFDWGEHLYHASDYFDQLYGYAIQLVKDGKAYVDSLTEAEIREYRGTVTEPGRPSPYRDRSVEENLDLLERMKTGEFEDGAHVLRARIDLASPNMKMRDPPFFRIRRVPHHRTGDAWNIYPLYDFAHCVSDSIEKITHSLCTLEFENNRELYDWFLVELGAYRPEQTEFARLNITYTVLSKRKLIDLVDGGHVEGWDDPRMPTLAGLRRRGYTPEAIRAFCERVGIARANSTVDFDLLQHAIREDLNQRAPRVMAVLDPVELVIDNYPDGETEQLEAVNNPEDAAAGTRMVPFSKTLYIERSDFMEEPPKKFFRLGPGREVRLKHAYFVTCTSVDKDDDGKIIRIHTTYDPASRGGESPDGRKVRGTLHWVSAPHAHHAEVRMYDHMFKVPEPGTETGNYLDDINPTSLEVRTNVPMEPCLADAKPGEQFQFMRQGYFVVDSTASTDGSPVFNRTVTMRDSWAKIQKAQARKRG